MEIFNEHWWSVSMDAPPLEKRGKLQDYELIWQFAPHQTSKGAPLPICKLVRLGPSMFLSTCKSELKVLEFDKSHASVHEVGVVRNCPNFTRGYAAAGITKGLLPCLPQGGFIAAGIASPHEANCTLQFFTFTCQKVFEVQIEGVKGIVSVAVTEAGHIVVGGLEGVALELAFEDCTHQSQLKAVMRGHEGEVQVFCGMHNAAHNAAIACGSAGSKLIADAKTDASLRIWISGTQVALIKDHDENVRCFSSCGCSNEVSGESFVTGSSDGSWVVRDASGQSMRRNYLPPNWNSERASILCVACINHNASPSQIVTGDDDKPGRMVLWDGSASIKQVILHPHEVIGIETFSHDINDPLISVSHSKNVVTSSVDLVSACKDGFLRVWSRTCPEKLQSVQVSQEAYKVAIALAQKNRAHIQRLQRDEGGVSTAHGGTISGIQYEHIISIALDDGNSGQPPIRIGFNQADFYKDIAGQVALRHDLDAENLSLLEKAIRGQQEQAAGPPRNLGLPGEKNDHPTKIIRRELKQICMRQVQKSGSGHTDLAKKLAKFNRGLRTRNRSCVSFVDHKSQHTP